MAVNNVNNLNNSQLNAQRAAQQTQGNENATQKGGTQSTAQARTDSVSLTPQVQQLARLQKKAEASSGVDQDKVAAVKKAIAEGKYQVNADRLAAKIASMEGDLFDK